MPELPTYEPDGGPQTLEEVRARHQPAGRFRFFFNRYPPNTSFPLHGKQRRVYVLAGSCSFETGDKTFILQSGASLVLPSGGSHFATVGTHEVSLVNVYEMPPSHWRSDD